MTTVEIYRKMLAYLFDNHLADNYACIAHKARVNEVQISRVRNGKVKSVKEETMRKVNAAYGNIFNPDWMRGQSDVMLVADLAPTAKDGTSPWQYAAAPGAPDISDLRNDVISAKDDVIAAKDDVIMALERELAAKDDTIAALQARIADKDELIRQKERLVGNLQQQVIDLRIEKGVSAGTSPLGVVDKDSGRARI